MFKKILIVMAFIIGCGDDIGSHDEDPEGYCKEGSTHPDCAEPSDAAEPEVGSLKQPIVLNVDYGATKTYGPCTHPFPGGICYGANNKTFTVVFHAYSCLTTVAPHNGAWWYQMIWGGVQRWRDYMNARGWNVTTVKQTAPGESFAHVDIFCYYGQAGTAMATTIITEGVDNVFDCHDTPHGDFCQYSIGTIAIRPDKAPMNPMWASATSTQRANMIDNVMVHEGLHYSGLAHRPHNPDAMNIMMPAIQSWLSTQWTTKMVPDVNQSLALYCYVHSSSTTPIVGCPLQ
jgi:hypothetical protein